MSVNILRGDLFQSGAQALINPVNTVGVMGAGLAKEFKRIFPDVFTEYSAACRRGDIVIGRVQVVERLSEPQFIINFPTKNHWKNPSELYYIQRGLRHLETMIDDFGIDHVAMPALGCGLGGLKFEDVKTEVLQVFDKHECLIELYLP